MAEAQQFFIDRTKTPIGEGVIISDADGAIRLFYWDDPIHRWKAALLQRYGEVTLKEKKGAFGHAKTLKNYFDGDLGGVRTHIAPHAPEVAGPRNTTRMN